MNSIVPSTSIQNQEQMNYLSDEPEISNYEMYLHKNNKIDENTLQSLPDDKKEELYKKYETFDSQEERYDMNLIQNNNPLTFGNINNKNSQEIESLQTLDDNNKFRVYHKNDNDNVNEYLEGDNLDMIITHKKNIVDEHSQFGNEGDNKNQFEKTDNNSEPRNLNMYIKESNQQIFQNNNEHFQELMNKENQNEDIQVETGFENIINFHNPPTNKIVTEYPTVKNKVKKYLFNNKISDSNLEQRQLNKNDNSIKNTFSNEILLERNTYPIINQHNENEIHSQSNTQSKELELQLEISQLKAQISSLQNKYDLLTREFQAEKAKNDLLQIKIEQQNDQVKEIENETLKKVAEYLKVQKNEEILPKISEIVSNMNKLNYDNSKNFPKEVFQNVQKIPEKMQTEENLHSSNINDYKLREELVSKLKILYIALSGNENTKDVDIKTVWRWIKHLIHTIKDLAQEKEKNTQMILELQEVCIFRNFCLEIMQEFNLNDLNKLKQFIYNNLSIQENQQNQNIDIRNNPNNNNDGYTYQLQQENQNTNYQINLNKGNYNNMNNNVYSNPEDDNKYEI
jgi:hypothetical protein